MRLFLTSSISVLMAVLFVIYFGASGVFYAAGCIILGSIALVILESIEKKKLLKILLSDLKFFGTHSFMGKEIGEIIYSGKSKVEIIGGKRLVTIPINSHISVSGKLTLLLKDICMCDKKIYKFRYVLGNDIYDQERILNSLFLLGYKDKYNLNGLPSIEGSDVYINETYSIRLSETMLEDENEIRPMIVVTNEKFLSDLKNIDKKSWDNVKDSVYLSETI
jgi:hypothetical protein